MKQIYVYECVVLLLCLIKLKFVLLMKYPFTKVLFRLKCPGLADNASQISSKTNWRFTTTLSFQRNEKYPNEDEQWLPQTLGCGLGRFVRRYNDCKYPHSYPNVRIRRRRRKFYFVKLT